MKSKKHQFFAKAKGKKRKLPWQIFIFLKIGMSYGKFFFQTSSTYPNDHFYLIKFLISIMLMVLKMLQVKMLVFQIFGKFVKFWQILDKIVEIMPFDPSSTFKPVLISFLHFLGTQKFLF